MTCAGGLVVLEERVRVLETGRLKPTWGKRCNLKPVAAERNVADINDVKCPFCNEPAIRTSVSGTSYRCGTLGPDINGEYSVGHTCDIHTWTRLLADKQKELADKQKEIDRLTATPCIPWRHHSEHGDTFEDGEQLMVAVPVRDNRTGKSYWEIECIVARVDDSDGTCSLESLYGDDWGWDWENVEWWLPMNEVLGTLPAFDAAEAAERQGEG